jgi:hypothetical protein
MLAENDFRTRRTSVVIIDVAVGIAQLAEHRTVAPTVAGSIPVSHPRFPSPLILIRHRFKPIVDIRRFKGAALS